MGGGGGEGGRGERGKGRGHIGSGTERQRNGGWWGVGEKGAGEEGGGGWRREGKSQEKPCRGKTHFPFFTLPTFF